MSSVVDRARRVRAATFLICLVLLMVMTLLATGRLQPGDEVLSTAAAGLALGPWSGPVDGLNALGSLPVFAVVTAAIGLVALDAGFPSGHAARMMALMVIVAAWWVPRHRWSTIGSPARLAAIAVRVARVVGGAHYPSDVLVGWLVGLLASIAVIVTATWSRDATDRMGTRS